MALQITEIEASQIPESRSRYSTDYTAIMKQLRSSKTKSLVISTENTKRSAKSLYWGLSVFIKKHQLQDKIKVILREKAQKVYLKTINSEVVATKK